MSPAVFWSIILILFSAVLMGIVFRRDDTETKKDNTITVGRSHLFRTNKAKEYLSFLENFDETNYEIVTISTSMSNSANGSDEFYMVTYRTKN